MPQVEIPGIDSIVSTIPDDFPDHAYFAEVPPILTDIENLILRNKPARSGKEWERVGSYWIVGGPENEALVVCR
jgi:hypothetical protein